MQKTGKNRLISVFLLTLFLLIYPVMPASAKSTGNCISEIMIVSGSDAEKMLENDGYTVLNRNLNIQSGEPVFLGYKMSGNNDDTVTGLMVGYSYKDIITVDGIDYYPVSDISLNLGNNGTQMYLYSTYDGDAGAGICSLSTVTMPNEVFESLEIIGNNGTFPVKDQNGAVADLEAGLERQLYLIVTPADIVRTYVGRVCLVTGADRDEALKDAALKDCPYYIDQNLSGSGSYAYLAFDRTADIGDAVTCIAFSDTETLSVNGIEMTKAEGGKAGKQGLSLYYTKNTTLGNPMLGINTNNALFPYTATVGEWCDVFYGGFPMSEAKLVVDSDPDLAAMKQDTRQVACIGVPTYADSSEFSLFMTVLEDGIKDKMPEAGAEPLQTKAVIETPHYEAEIDGVLPEVSSEESPDEENQTDSRMVTGSVIGSGNMIVVFVSLALLLVALGGAVIVLNMKKKKKEDGGK